MRLLLVSRSPKLRSAWEQCFADPGNVSVIDADICRVECDAVVSPANSFGFMDGGLDLALSERFGWDVQERLQRTIRVKHAGELLVGQAEIVPTLDPNVPWLISAPTMRVPMRIRASVNPYLAMRAVLLAVKAHAQDPAIDVVAVPGLGTGVGAVPLEVAALQMWTAYEQVVLGKDHFPDDVGRAAEAHLRLNPILHLFD